MSVRPFSSTLLVILSKIYGGECSADYMCSNISHCKRRNGIQSNDGHCDLTSLTYFVIVSCGILALLVSWLIVQCIFVGISWTIAFVQRLVRNINLNKENYKPMENSNDVENTGA